MLKKRLCSIILSIVMLLTLMPVNCIPVLAGDDEGDPTGPEVRYAAGFSIDDSILFDDGDLEVRLEITVPENTVEGTDYEINIFALAGGNEEPDDCLVLFKKGTDYEVRPAGDGTNDRLITLHGELMVPQINEIYGDSFWLMAELRDPNVDGEDGQHRLLANDSRLINAENSVLYLDDVEDRKMIPYEFGYSDITPAGTGSIRSSKYRGSFEFTLVNMEIVDMSPEGTDVIEIFDEYAEDPENSLWLCMALNPGTATVRVTFIPDFDDIEYTYDFTVTVANDIYEAKIEDDADGFSLYSKADVNMQANVTHQSVSGSGSENYKYEWNVALDRVQNGSSQDVADYASVTVDPDDPSKAVLNVADLSDEADNINVAVSVSVDVYDLNDESGGTLACASAGCYYEIEKIKYEVVMTGHDKYLEPDEPEEVTLEMRFCPGPDGADYGLAQNSRLGFCYDSEEMLVYDASGNIVESEELVESSSGSETFTLERISEGFVSFELIGSPNDDMEFRHMGSFNSADEPFDGYSIGLYSNTDMLYTDGGLDVYLDLSELPGEEGTDWEIGVLGIGFWDPDKEEGEEDAFVDLTGYEGCVTISDDPAGKVIHLDGAKICAVMDQYDTYKMYIHVDVGEPGEGGQWLGGANKQIEVSLPYEHYETEQDRDMLPGWDGYIGKEYPAFFENTEFPGPNGFDTSYIVNDVEIITEEPEVSGRKVISLEKEVNDNDPENYRWRYEAINYGLATLKVYYTDIDGEPQDYTFNIRVGGDVYEVDLSPDNMFHFFLPGSTVDMSAWSRHMSDDEERDGDISGITYEWSIEEEDHFGAELAQDPEDGSKAKLYLDEEESNYRLIIKVTIYDGIDDHGHPVKRAENDTAVIVRDDFYELHPADIEGLNAAGDSTDVTTKLLHYSTDTEEPEETEVYFRWYYDNECIKITDIDGNTVGNKDEEGYYIGSPASYGSRADFHIERLNNEETEIRLCASWIDESLGEKEEWQSYFIRGADDNYKIWLEHDDDRLFEDGTLEFNIRTEGLPEDEDAYEIYISAGRYDYENDEWTVEFTEGDEYKIDGDKITLFGEDIFASGMEDYVDIVAELKVNGETVSRDDKRAWLCEIEENYDLPEDRSMLPGWDERIDRFRNVWVRNFENKDGTDFDFEITDVRVSWNEPADGMGDVLYLEKQYADDDESSDDYWWWLRARECGTAKLEITYETLSGEEETYIYTIYVGDDVYEVDVRPEDGFYIALPGSTVDLYTDLRHMSTDGERDGDISNAKYVWKVTDQAEHAAITPYENDPSKAHLILDPPAPGEEDIHGEVRVEVIIYDGVDEETGEDIERARGDIRIEVSDRYAVVAPPEIDRWLPVGSSQVIIPRLRLYRYGEDDYQVIEDVHFRWYYNDNELEIRDEYGNVVGNNNDDDEYNDSEASYGNGRSFTIKRTENGRPRIDLRVDWTNKYGDEEEAGTSYELDDLNYNVWFDSDSNQVFEDGDLTMWLRYDGIPDNVSDHDIDIDLNVGQYDHESGDWETRFPLGQDYDFDPETGKLTLHGTELIKRGENYQVWITAQLKIDGNIVTENRAEAWVRAVETHYDFIGSMSMLPGWDRDIPKFNHVWVRNSEFPDGMDDEYEILDIEVIRNEPYDGEGQVIRFEKHYADGDETSDDYWWWFAAEDYGDAELKVTYRTVDGGTDSYGFVVNVSGEVYGVNVRTSDGFYQSLPGKTVELIAEAWHDAEDNDLNCDISNVKYQWVLDGQEEHAKLIPDANDPTKALLVINDPEEGEENIDGELRVEVIIFDGVDGETGEDIERARGDVRIHVSDRYHEIAPSEINRRLDLGKTETIAPEVRLYRYGEDGYEVIDDVHFRWYYDDTAVEILDESGNKVGNNDGNDEYIDSEASYGNGREFSIKRLAVHDTRISLRVDWENEYGDYEETARDYFLDDIFYNIRFDQFETSVYDDWKETLKPVTDDLGDLEYSIAYTVGYMEWHEGEEDSEWRFTLPEGEIYTVDPETSEITVYGDKLKAALIKQGADIDDGINIQAMLIYGDDWILNDTFTWMRIKEACYEHSWYENLITTPGCETTGLKSMYCPVCGERRENVVIPAYGHSLTHVPAKEPTTAAEGNIEYWRCERCGKLFSDAEGQNEITEADTVIEKIKGLEAATVTGIVDKTFTGSAITQSPTVKLGGKTLKNETDYTLSYKNNKNPGTATVIITGKGDYSGSISKTFRVLFTDVPANHGFANAVYWANGEGIAAGYSGKQLGLFGVGDDITRGQVVMFLWRAANKPEPKKNTQTFKDVPTNHAFYKAIQWASEEGITGGYSDKTFRPNDNCTRGQIAMFLWRFDGKPAPAAGGKTFKDVPKSNNFYTAIMWASGAKITAGYSDGTFGIDKSCTRGHCVTFLYRLLG